MSARRRTAPTASFPLHESAHHSAPLLPTGARRGWRELLRALEHERCLGLRPLIALTLDAAVTTAAAMAAAADANAGTTDARRVSAGASDARSVNRTLAAVGSGRTESHRDVGIGLRLSHSDLASLKINPIPTSQFPTGAVPSVASLKIHPIPTSLWLSVRPLPTAACVLFTLRASEAPAFTLRASVVPAFASAAAAVAAAVVTAASSAINGPSPRQRSCSRARSSSRHPRAAHLWEEWGAVVSTCMQRARSN